MPYEAKHPVILKKHHATVLLLRYLHESRCHQGVESILAHVRQRFWIVGGRRILRSIVDRCVACRKANAKISSENTPPLPKDRVCYQRPFSLTGIDYAGPVLVKSDKVVKVWIALFVCGTTRAVHLEIVDSLATEEFLLAFRKFCGSIR